MADAVELKIREFFNSKVDPFLVIETTISDEMLVKLYTQCVVIMSIISEDDYSEIYDEISDRADDLQAEILRRMETNL